MSCALSALWVVLHSGCTEGVPPGAEGSATSPLRDAAGSASHTGPASPSATTNSTANSSANTELVAVATKSTGTERQPTAPRVPPKDAPRVFAKTRNVWIRGKPTSKTQWIGFLWFGNSVRLKATEPVPGPGCKQGWYAVEPRGYVCVDGERATLDPEDEVLQGVYPLGPDPTQANPHPHYGESTNSPRYYRLPTDKHQSRREWDSRIRKQRIAEARETGSVHESLLGVDLTPAGQDALLLPTLPRTLQLDHTQLIPRSAVAWSREVDHDERTWLLTDDLAWVPKDRVVPYPEVKYQGIHLGAGLELPLASFREQDRPRYEQNSDGSFSETGKTFARLSWVALSGRTAQSDEKTFFETKGGDWLREDEAVIPEARETTPWGAKVGSQQDPESAPRGRGTWIDVSVLGGWLLAYEGTKPVFVTLMSPGRGGVPHGKRPALETASTPTGRFKITGKFITAAMIAPNKLVHSAVPWAQNFSGPHALHGAYWHNAWGEKKSGGCINVSPKDGKWLFGFTEPRIPPGWHGVRWLPKREASTTLLVRR